MALTQEQQNIDAFAKQVAADVKVMGQAVNGLPINIKTLNVIGNGATDDTAAIKAALSDSNRAAVYFPKGTYNVSAPIPIADNLIVRFDRQAIINVTGNFAANLINGNDARYVFLPGNNTVIDSVQIDCKSFIAGGICVIQKSNVLIKNCTVKNWAGVFGIADIGANQVWYAQNTVRNGVHGLHSYKSTRVTMSENIVDVMTGGGIYSAWCYKVSWVGNIVTNCGDVGLDFEGGAMCTSFGNTVERCKNGELALFSGNGEDTTVVHHLIHRGNTVHRQAKYTTGYDGSGNPIEANVDTGFGACVFMSVADGSYEVGFEQNTIVVDSGAGLGLYHYQATNIVGKRIHFTRNTVTTSGAFFRCLNSVGFRFTQNEFYGLAGSETSQNEFRDAHGADIRDNTFRYMNPKTSGYTLLLNTSSNFATKAPYVGFNTFINAPGLALQIDLFNNGSLNPIVRSNNLGDTYTANGGMSITSNGNATLKDQRLKVLMSESGNDYSGVTALGRSGASKAVGFIGYGRQGYNGSSAIVQYIAGTGFFASTGVVANGLEIRNNSNGPILNNTTGTACIGTMDLEVNTY